MFEKVGPAAGVAPGYDFARCRQGGWKVRECEVSLNIAINKASLLCPIEWYVLPSPIAEKPRKVGTRPYTRIAHMAYPCAPKRYGRRFLGLKYSTSDSNGPLAKLEGVALISASWLTAHRETGREACNYDRRLELRRHGQPVTLAYLASGRLRYARPIREFEAQISVLK